MVKRDFDMKYFFERPYRDYLLFTAICMRRDIAQARSKPLMGGESLDDLCILASLRMPPPKGLPFPGIYQGMLVFYEVEGPRRK